MLLVLPALRAAADFDPPELDVPGITIEDALYASPPDPVGDVGPEHFVQMTNGAGARATPTVEIFDKHSGALVDGPF